MPAAAPPHHTQPTPEPAPPQILAAAPAPVPDQFTSAVLSETARLDAETAAQAIAAPSAAAAAAANIASLTDTLGNAFQAVVSSLHLCQIDFKDLERYSDEQLEELGARFDGERQALEGTGHAGKDGYLEDRRRWREQFDALKAKRLDEPSSKQRRMKEGIDEAASTAVEADGLELVDDWHPGDTSRGRKAPGAAPDIAEEGYMSALETPLAPPAPAHPEATRRNHQPHAAQSARRSRSRAPASDSPAVGCNAAAGGV